MEIIGVDTGNKAMKTPGCDPFPTGLVRHGQNEPVVRCDSLMFEGFYYSLSQDRTPYKQDKTVDDTYYLLTLIAIAKNLMAKYPNQDFYKNDICLAMGLPPQHMAALKKKYFAYFGHNGQRINFTYNDIPFEITVKHVFVYPQGFSVTAAANVQNEIKKYPRSYVVDIGGYTTDVIRFVGHKNSYAPDLSFCESFDRGIIEMLSSIESELRTQCSLSVDDYMAEALFRGNSEDTLFSDEAIQVAQNAGNAYAENLLRSISEKVKDDFKTSYFVFMGGGASLMRSAIERAINKRNLYFVDDVAANARGYEVMARAQLMELGEA